MSGRIFFFDTMRLTRITTVHFVRLWHLATVLNDVHSEAEIAN
jgi:hypothetical protein